MPVLFVQTEEELPDYVDHQCVICLDNVKPRGSLTSDGVPNCVMCENGHRMHRECSDRWLKSLGKRECPTCKSTNITNCWSFVTGYAYSQRTGGRRKNKTHKKRKTHKRKKTKTNRRSKSKNIKL
jgi:hypothetical protein